MNCHFHFLPFRSFSARSRAATFFLRIFCFSSTLPMTPFCPTRGPRCLRFCRRRKSAAHLFPRAAFETAVWQPGFLQHLVEKSPLHGGEGIRRMLLRIRLTLLRGRSFLGGGCFAEESGGHALMNDGVRFLRPDKIHVLARSRDPRLLRRTLPLHSSSCSCCSIFRPEFPLASLRTRRRTFLGATL